MEDTDLPRHNPATGHFRAEESAMHDLVIRGATVVDGLGHDPFRADVAVKDGRIAKIAARASTLANAAQ
jgi:N-acyl-D-aspartate/D-glutamate deacylase